MRRPWVAILVVAAFALAGCSGGNGGGAFSSAGPATDTGTAAPVNATPPAPIPLLTPIHIDGSTAAGGCVLVASEEQCHYEMTETAFNELDAPGRPLRLVGNLTWTAVSPSSQALTVYVPEVRSDGFHWEEGDPARSGPSPLFFDLNLTDMGDVRIGLIVGNGVVQPFAVGYAAVQTPQDFVLDAVLVTQP